MIVLAAALWDLVLGEPPARVHPVVWTGKAIDAVVAWAPRSPASAFAWGALSTVVLAGAAAAAAFAVRLLPYGLDLMASLFLLKSSFAVRALVASGAGVASALNSGDLAAARTRVGQIVSRDVTALDPEGVSAAAVQSVAENLSDSVVAPLFWYAVGGVPAALAYRVVNTLDARIGYRGRYEWLGKFPARLDDVLNLVPARITAALLLLLRPSAVGTWWRHHGRTASPNGGHPMAAAAGVLGVRLEKVGHYVLGDGPLPDAATIGRMNTMALAVAAMAVAMAAAA